MINDVSMRDFQYRTLQWLQGKTFEHTTPFGPYLVTTDEWLPGRLLSTARQRRDDAGGRPPATWCSRRRSSSPTSPQIVTLNPGDVIATGTPGGVGHARKPPRYLTDGARLETSIEGLGAQANRAVAVR